ncbi:hypothetical protein DERF_006377 [Dermatophagoides farinae]|uniref:Uncharacterized protein n=1 Tax=Dermatophagoides farinae TaxID=6954 RepID=A0A922L7M8_DERFA|nr:hypothetical protein DERF_006377 [Dermatophagoides farinae]
MHFNNRIYQLQSLLVLAIILQQTMANMLDDLLGKDEPEVVHHHVSVPMKIIKEVPYHVPMPIMVKQKPEVKTIEVPVKVPVAIPVKIPVKIPYPVYVKVPYPIKIPHYESYHGGYGQEKYGGGGGGGYGGGHGGGY